VKTKERAVADRVLKLLRPNYEKSERSHWN